MEYLKNIDDKLKTISEENIVYYGINELAKYWYGAPNIHTALSFEKYPVEMGMEMEKKLEGAETSLHDEVMRSYNRSKNNTTGQRIKFSTKSRKIIIKAEVRRKWDYLKMTLYNSSGFDIYEKKNEMLKHKTVIAPNTGLSCFAEQIMLSNEVDEVIIYLPLYNDILNLYIGVLDGEISEAKDYTIVNPVIFYGNSITQGSAASRSGNTFCNIVSRLLDADIINFSLSGCARGLLSNARVIGQLNASAIVIDYTRNALGVEDLENTHEKFYLEIRKYHPQIPIVLLSSSNFNNNKTCYEYDKIVYTTYIKAKNIGHNTFFINQRNLFPFEEDDICTVDGIHYNDYGMFKVGKAIAEVLEKNKYKNSEGVS